MKPFLVVTTRSKRMVGLLAVCARRLPPLFLLCALTASVQAQFEYSNEGGTITIAHYTGPGGVVSIPDTIDGLPVTRIGESAFRDRTDLTGVTIPDSFTSIAEGAFHSCTGLTGVYFEGNAPAGNAGAFAETPARIYFLPGTTGWGPEYSGRPTALWVRQEPVILDFGPSFGVGPNGFGFMISWATNASVLVEACASLADPAWTRVSTNTLTSGTATFTDPDWAHHPARYYRVRGE